MPLLGFGTWLLKDFALVTEDMAALDNLGRPG